MPASDFRVTTLLHEAVTALGGQERAGQVEMAEAVATAFTTASTCSSRPAPAPASRSAYLVPSLLHDQRVSSSPPPPWRCSTSSSSATSRASSRRWPVKLPAQGRPSYAVLKGRSNYACLHRIREGVPDDQGALVDVPVGSMAEKILELRGWAEQEAEDGEHRRARQRPAPHRPRVAPGQRQPPRVPRCGQVPVRRRSASPSRPGRRRSAPTSSSPTTRCWPSTRSRACR